MVLSAGLCALLVLLLLFQGLVGRTAVHYIVTHVGLAAFTGQLHRS
jgi:hypothetical protein